MRHPDAGTVQSVRQRLLNRARDRREDFQFTLTRFGVERFLYRLSRCPMVEHYVVKGATLFSIWLDEPHRPTRDLDMNRLRAGASDDIESDLKAAFQVECPQDGLVFDPESLSVSRIRHAQEIEGVRVKFVARLGSAVISLQLDLGFGDAVAPPPQMEDFPLLLADLPAPWVKLYPKEAFIAEKLDAMARLGETNSRVKDFSDVALLARSFSFDGPELQRAVESTLERRRTLVTQTPPVALRSSFYSDADRVRRWRSLASENPAMEGLGSFQQVGELVISFLLPVWTSMVRAELLGKRWEPGSGWAH